MPPGGYFVYAIKIVRGINILTYYSSLVYAKYPPGGSYSYY